LKTINVIGCGSVGSTLARLWTDRGVLQVLAILNRSLESARHAVRFAGAGHAVEHYQQLPPADLVMIAARDEAIESCCRKLCNSATLGEGVIVFHLSGSLQSTVLSPAEELGAKIASVHPVKSFAEPSSAVHTFPGTYCAIEGDAQACQALSELFQRSGAVPFRIDPQSKAIYHAGTVFVSNYLVALIEVGLQCLHKAAVPRETAMKIIEPMVRGTIQNVANLGPVKALTGPIARGELSVVEEQVKALQWDADIGAIYQTLGLAAVQLSRSQGSAADAALAAIEGTLRQTAKSPGR
jgi:predicted short-subunit dehydrogenase-like oxidoreductase (DUF2520 family)